jgi:hypothetical protein
MAGLTFRYPFGMVSQAPSSQTSMVFESRGMPSHIKNAVKMIQPFYSENATVDKARAFWNAFERATDGLDEQLRLNAFRECLKGKTGEDWWTYSRISDFETLRVRFYKCAVKYEEPRRTNRGFRTGGERRASHSPFAAQVLKRQAQSSRKKKKPGCPSENFLCTSSRPSPRPLPATLLATPTLVLVGELFASKLLMSSRVRGTARCTRR